MKGVRVLVIGGGFSGVAAAVGLRDRGASVTLLDERPTLGGRARSDDLEGFAIDTGAQLIASSFTRTLRILSPGTRTHSESAPNATPDRAVHSLHQVPGRDAYLRDGERYPLQFGSVRSLLSFGGLSAMEKLKLVTHTLPALTANHAALDAAVRDIPASLDAGSARAYMATNVGGRAADVLVEPPLNAFYGMRGSEVSLAFYLMLGRYASDGDMIAPTAGWSRALDAILTGVDCHRNVKVNGLSMTDGDEVVADGSDGSRWAADGAVIATGPRSAAALLAPLLADDDPLLAWLSSVALRATWTIALALDTAPRRDAFGIFHDAPHARIVSACAVHGAKMDHPPSGRDVVFAWPTPAAIAELRGKPSSAIVAAMLPEIEALVPDVRGHVIHARVYRFDEGTPIAHPGFAADRTRGRQLAGQLALPIALAGDYLTAPLLEGAVASGDGAATLLQHRLQSRP